LEILDLRRRGVAAKKENKRPASYVILILEKEIHLLPWIQLPITNAVKNLKGKVKR